MSEWRHIRSLGVEREGRAYLHGYDEAPIEPGRVRLETLYSGFSAGTELTFVKNSNPYLHSRWDAGRGVFAAGEPQQQFPVPFLGYMESARVLESDTDDFRSGEIVGAVYGHKSGHTADPFHDVLTRLPPGMDPILGIYVGQMGPIAANGILHADAELLGGDTMRLGASLSGRPVLVIGAGVVGLLVALFAQKAGASEVVIAEPAPFRQLRAACLGLTPMSQEQAWNHAKTRWLHGGNDRGADIVFQTRSDSASLHVAMQALRPQGTVIDLAFYQGGAMALRLGEEFHHNGLNLRCAQINRVPRAMRFSWNRQRLAAETVALLVERGDAIMAQMITHVVPLEEAPDFIQIVFKAAG